MSNAVTFDTTAEVRDACLCLHAQRAARALARRFDDELRVTGLTSGQFSLLMSLNRPDAPAIGPVAKLLAMDRTTLTAALKPLVRKGFVLVEADAKDRRTRLLKLTDDGRGLLALAVPIWRATHVDIEAKLSVLTPDLLRAALNALT